MDSTYSKSYVQLEYHDRLIVSRDEDGDVIVDVIGSKKQGGDFSLYLTPEEARRIVKTVSRICEA